MHNLADRALKERIIGAVVLVVVAVLVVPIFLDGPSDDQDVITESVTLPGQNDQERTQQTIVLERDRSQPVPATRAAEPPQAAPQQQSPVQTSSPPSEDPSPIVDAAPTEVEQSTIAASASQSSTGMWAVQLGSFSNKENAERLAADLRDQGFAAFLSEVFTSGNALQRVRIGPQKDRASAESIAAQLARAGHEGRVVPHP